MITIQTSVQETFREASAASEDVFSQHFETDIQKLETETPPHSVQIQNPELPQSPSSTARYNQPKAKEKLETRLVKSQDYTPFVSHVGFQTVLTNQETNFLLEAS